VLRTTWRRLAAEPEVVVAQVAGLLAAPPLGAGPIPARADRIQ
jgi:hypothetical protein